MELKVMIKLFLFFLISVNLFCQTAGFSPVKTKRRNSGSNLRQRKTLSTSVIGIHMPGASPHKVEEYLCTSSRRLPKQTLYIVEYEPNASATTAHHILLYGCKYPGSRKKIW
eukprot:gene9679-10666_t